jgi:hypothetical protein
VSQFHKDPRACSIYRVRRCNPETGEVSGTRYYAQRPAAEARAQRWTEAGYRVYLDRAGPVRFHGYR